jgi:hypothetical protein
VRQLAQLLCLDAALKAESHRGAEASQSLARALQIKKAIRSPATVWHLSHMVGDKAVCATLERVLNCTELTEPDLSLLATELVYDPPNDLKEVLALELTSELTHIEFWRGMATQMVNKAWTPIDRLSAKYVARRMFRDEEFLAYLEWQDGRFASFRSSTRQQVEWLATNSPPKQRTAKDASMAMLFIATMPNLVTQEAQWLARLRLARTAVAIERWRLAHEGRLLDSLAELAPTFLPVLPADPFDDQLLRFKKLARGYVVYSIGADFTDDSGKKKPEKAKEDDHYDIAFTVER